jgi:spore germination cell wall hydrolase CwlJ-like protein
MTPIHQLPDAVVLALTIYGEARGEPVEGQIAVACVVRNRLKAKAGARWRDICLAPAQFSCFNADDPNYALMERAANVLMTQSPPPELAQAEWIADGIISGACYQDPTNGANHYLTESLFLSHPPSWAINQPVRASVGRHIFLDVP